MEQIYDSRHSGWEVDNAVDAVQTTIPAQLTQIGLKLDNLERVANSVGSLYVNNTYTITAGTIGGGNRTFTISDLGLAVGDNLIFRLNCSNGEVNRYRVITSNGKVPTRSNALYYQPNVTYTISITNSEFVSASTFGFLVDAADTLVSGTATGEVMVVHRNKIGLAEKLYSLDEILEDVRYPSTEEALINGYYIATGNAVGETAALQTYSSADYGYAIIDCMEGDIFTLTTYVNTAIAKAYTILDENNVILAFQQDSASNLQVTIPSGGVKIVVNSRIRSYAPSIIHTFSRFGRYEKEIEEIHDDISELDANVQMVGSELSKVSDSVGTAYLENTYTITEGAISGGNGTFNISDLNASIGDILIFKVTSNNGEIGRYIILTNGGKVPHGTNGDYYLPNRTYTISISVPEFLSSSKFGFYIKADDALAGGTVHAEMLVLRQGNVSLSSVLAELYGNISEAQQGIATLEEDVAELEEQVGLPLSGKTVWTIGDSLFHNTWQSHFVDISGATWYAELNTLNSKPISWGGSNSSPDVDSGSQARAINLVSYKNDYDMDIVLFENINDRNLLSRGGSIDDVPFMRSQKISYPISETLPTYAEVKSYVDANLSSIVSSIDTNTRKRGTIISIPYTSGSQVRGSRITFLTTPTSEGDITINLNGAKSVHVTTGMTIQDIVDAFIQYSYGAGWTDVDNGDGSISIYYYTTTSTRATFDGGSTGVTARVEDTTGTGEYNLFFIGDGVSEWEDTTKWVTTLSLYSIYKGLIEYLKTELPESQLYLVFPFSVGVDFSATTYKHGDGTWSQDKFIDSTTYANQKALYDIQRECADFYGVPCLDLVAEAGMNIVNIETFFYTNNVHPKALGYNRYADTILKLLK